MSHFTVLIIGKNPEKQLAPFDENIEVKRYVEYTKAELIERERKDIENYKNSIYAEYLKNPEKYSLDSNEEHLKYVSEEFPKKLEWSDEQLYAESIRYYEVEDIGKEGEVYSTRNPKSKWDWYELGGRWQGMFKLKNTSSKECTDQALKGEIDFESMTSDNLKNAEKCYGDFEEKLKNDPMRKTFNPYFEFGIENKGDRDTFVPETKEEFIKRNVGFYTFAIIKDGEWYEKGNMGFWAIVSNEKKDWLDEFQEILNSVPDDTLLSIYDCHI